MGWYAWLLLQGTDPAGSGAPQGGGGIWSMIPLFVILYGVAYFMMIRPQKKQQREHEALLNDLKKNDDVRTSGGIFGKVVSVDKDRDMVTMKIDEQNNVRMRVARASIVAVLDKKKDSANKS